MRFEILDTSRGDVLAVFSSRDEAEASLATYLTDRADQVDDLAIAAVDDSGQASRRTSGAELSGVAARSPRASSGRKQAS